MYMYTRVFIYKLVAFLQRLSLSQILKRFVSAATSIIRLASEAAFFSFFAYLRAYFQNKNGTRRRRIVCVYTYFIHFAGQKSE
jgi:hypothetical protein